MTERTIEVNAYAKINLSLDVLGQRPDGYHEVSMVMHLTGLHDLVRVSVLPGRAECRVQTDAEDLPAGPGNLVYKAWERFTEAAGAAPLRVQVEIKKEIPIAAGLAGGSADAAAALLAYNKLMGDSCSLKELMKIGAGVGSDVPFVLAGIAAADPAARPARFDEKDLFVCALASGTGTDLTGEAPLETELLLVKDPVGVSTAEAYTALDDPQWAAGITRRPDTEALLTALAEKRPEGVYAAMANVMEAYTLKAYPEVVVTKTLLEETVRAAGESPAAVQMSGTGPTLFALSRDAAMLDAAAASMKALDPDGKRRVIRSRLLPFDR